MHVSYRTQFELIQSDHVDESSCRACSVRACELSITVVRDGGARMGGAWLGGDMALTKRAS